MTNFSEDLASAKQGDRDALERLCGRCGSIVEHVLRGRIPTFLRRHYDTADFRQSVLTEVVRDIPGFEDRGEGGFCRWVETKAVNMLRGRLRRHLHRRGGRRELTLTTDAGAAVRSAEPTPLETSLRREGEEALEDAIRGLEEHYQLAIHLRQEEALSFSEIARWMSLPSSEAARKVYARALLRLRTSLKGASRPPSPTSSGG